MTPQQEQPPYRPHDCGGCREVGVSQMIDGQWAHRWKNGNVTTCLAATPSPSSGLDVEAQAESDYHGNIIWHVPVDIPGTYHITLIEKATLNFDEPDFSDYSDEEQK